MSKDDIDLLKLLRPRRSDKIMELVEQAGIDVSKWSVNENGTKIKTTPAANPQYCYEWAFGGNGEPTLLCIWHRSMALPDFVG
jgi:5-methylcytosine-specific restriction protein A